MSNSQRKVYQHQLDIYQPIGTLTFAMAPHPLYSPSCWSRRRSLVGEHSRGWGGTYCLTPPGTAQAHCSSGAEPAHPPTTSKGAAQSCHFLPFLLLLQPTRKIPILQIHSGFQLSMRCTWRGNWRKDERQSSPPILPSILLLAFRAGVWGQIKISPAVHTHSLCSLFLVSLPRLKLHTRRLYAAVNCNASCPLGSHGAAVSDSFLTTALPVIMLSL